LRLLGVGLDLLPELADALVDDAIGADVLSLPDAVDELGAATTAPGWPRK